MKTFSLLATSSKASPVRPFPVPLQRCGLELPQTAGLMTRLAIMPLSPCNLISAAPCLLVGCSTREQRMSSCAMRPRSASDTLAASTAYLRARPQSWTRPQTVRRASTETVAAVDYTMLLACSLEVPVPARIEQVLQYEERAVYLKLRTAESAHTLHLSWHPMAARLCLGQLPSRGASSEAFAFGEQLQEALRSGILQRVSLPVPWERVVELQVGERSTDPPTLRVYLEVLGRHSNVILTDASRTILAAGYQVGGKQSSMRHLQVGGTYTLPPPARGLPPSMNQPLLEWQSVVTRAAEQSGSEIGVAVGMVRGYQGMSPAVAADLCHTAGISPGLEPSNLTEQQWTALQSSWLTWVEGVLTNKFMPASVPEEGRISVIGVGAPYDGTISQLVDAHYSNAREAQATGLLREQISRALATAGKKLSGKITNFEKQIQGSEDAAQTQKTADLLMANLHRCDPRASSVRLEDWDDGSMIEVGLNPTKTAVQNAEALYKRAGKQRRAIDKVVPLHEAACKEDAYLAEVEVALDQLEDNDLGALRGIREELMGSGYMKALSADRTMAGRAAAKAKKAAKRSRSRLDAFRCFLSPGGFAIIVGRNNKQNDELTHEIAKPADLWMHARGVPGAHVILQNPANRKDEPTDADVLAAADIAAWFSKKRNETRCEVITTAPKHLSRPKGAHPGQVKVARETVVLANPQRAPTHMSTDISSEGSR